MLWLDVPRGLTESQHMLLVQGVQLQSHRVELMLNSSKANKLHNLEVITLLAQEHSSCPVKLIWDYAKIRPRVPGQFFSGQIILPSSMVISHLLFMY